MSILVIMAIVIGLYMAWNIGANDVANSMADAVGSKALTVFWAMVLAGICEFSGSVLVGSHVANTIREGIIKTNFFVTDPQVLAHGMVCAMLAAAVWLNIASCFGMPVSTTHSIVGAVFGFGLLTAGVSHIHWVTLVQIVSSWFISPVAGGVAAFLIFKLISGRILSARQPVLALQKGIPVCVFFTFGILVLATIYRGLNHLHLDLDGYQAFAISIAVGLAGAGVSFLLVNRNRDCYCNLTIEEQLEKAEKAFAPLVIISSCTVAFAHGANDVANAIGPLAAVLQIARDNAIVEQVPIATWILCLGGGGIVLGLVTFGYRVMSTVGTKVTEITPSRGVAADLATMSTVLICSRLGLPISTTHTLVGAILGVGLARGITAIDRKVVSSIFTSWIATIPIAAILTIVFYLIAKAIWW